MLALKFRTVEFVFRTWPRLLNNPYCHRLLNKVFVQYERRRMIAAGKL